MQGHLHTDGLVHLMWEADVGWLEPLYGFVSICPAIHADGLAGAGNYVSTTSGHTAAQATCLECIARNNK